MKSYFKRKLWFQIFKEFFKETSEAPLKSEFNSDIKLIKDPLNCVYV